MCLTEPEEAAYFAAGDGKLQSYYIDSGATNHYVSDVDSLQDYIAFDAPKPIKTAKARSLSAIGLGILRFTATVDGVETSGELEDIYYIPGIETRLISLGKLFTQGWRPHLNQYGISVSNWREEVIFRAPMHHNTYIVWLHAIPTERSYYVWDTPDDELQEPLTALLAQECQKPVSLFDWHQRMGHPRVLSIVKMAQYTVNGMAISRNTEKDMVLDDCPTCALTKAVRHPFSGTRTRATEVLQLVHRDLAGPMPVESIGKHKYAFVLCDDYSRAGWILAL